MRPRASTALVVKVSGVRANPESFKRYRDSGSSARAFRADEDAPRELCRLTASSNDIALLEKERENEREREREKETDRTRPRQRERERAAATRVVSDACNRYRLTTLAPTSAATPSLPPPSLPVLLPPPSSLLPPLARAPSQATTVSNTGGGGGSSDGGGRRLLAFLSINSSNIHAPISFYLS